MEDPEIDLLLHRALMADCALQASESMGSKDLDALRLVPGSGGAAAAAAAPEEAEESLLDALKTAVQKLGPNAIQIAGQVVAKHMPGILDRLAKAIDGGGHATIAGAANVSVAYEGDDRYGEWDDMKNPDAPVRELRAPAEPN